MLSTQTTLIDELQGFVIGGLAEKGFKNMVARVLVGFLDISQANAIATCLWSSLKLAFAGALAGPEGMPAAVGQWAINQLSKLICRDVLACDNCQGQFEYCDTDADCCADVEMRCVEAVKGGVRFCGIMNPVTQLAKITPEVCASVPNIPKDLCMAALPAVPKALEMVGGKVVGITEEACHDLDVMKAGSCAQLRKAISDAARDAGEDIEVGLAFAASVPGRLTTETCRTLNRIEPGACDTVQTAIDTAIESAVDRGALPPLVPGSGLIEEAGEVLEQAAKTLLGVGHKCSQSSDCERGLACTRGCAWGESGGCCKPFWPVKVCPDKRCW